MSEFPEVFHPEAAREILDNETDPAILKQWLRRGIEEVESLYAHNEKLAAIVNEIEQQKRDAAALERFRLFKEKRGIT